jgi:hypothetical protein
MRWPLLTALFHARTLFESGAVSTRRADRGPAMAPKSLDVHFRHEGSSKGTLIGERQPVD